MIDHRRAVVFLGAAASGLLAVLLATFTGTPAGAANFDVFEVRGVSVDVTSETAAAARTEALADGERVAFRRLLERLTLRADHDRLPRLEGEEIAHYVRDFSVAQEKDSEVRYLATLDYRFKADEIRQLLTAFGLPFAETPSKPVLVLPVYQAAGALMLWDDPNPWHRAWGARPSVDGLVPLMLPLGDLNDIATIGAQQVVNGDVQRLGAIAARYGAGDTLVAHGVLEVDPVRGLSRLEISATRYGVTISEQTTVLTVTATPDEGIDQLLTRAAGELARQIEDNWKRDNLLHFDESNVLAVIVRIRGLEDWLEVRRQLSQVAVIDRLDLVLLSRQEVRVNLHYIGDPGQLSLAMEQADLFLKRDGDDQLLGMAGR